MIKACGTSCIIKHLDLTGKELETLCAVVNGKSQKEIAYTLHISQACVSSRIKQAMRRNKFTNKQDFLIEIKILLNAK